MYKCENCNKSSRSGEKLHKVVTQTRVKNYFNENTKVSEKKNTVGFETVQEIGICGNCLNETYNSRD